ELHAIVFQGQDVIIPLDNDQAGRERGHAIAKSLYRIAARVRVLDWRDHWPDAPKGADVSDWRDHAGGARRGLCEIMESLPDWEPPEPDVRFRLMRADKIKMTAGPRYLVRGLVPYPGMTVVWGPPKCGKSFVVSDMLFHVACGVDYRGRRVVP